MTKHTARGENSRRAPLCFSRRELFGAFLAVAAARANARTTDDAVFSIARIAGLRAANRYRQFAGLPPFRLDAGLCAAAQAHADYLALHRRGGHYQLSGDAGFTGFTPWRRAEAAGYALPFGRGGALTGSIDEDVGGGRSVDEAVRRLFDAPYHRALFFPPGTPDLGVGVATERTSGYRRVVLNVGAVYARESVVVYPADGQQNVPLSWDDRESPDPRAPHGRKGPVGYVAGLFVFPRGDTGLTLVSATLATDAGRPVSCLVNHPGNDPHLPNGVFLLPDVRRLEPLTGYVASIKVESGMGRRIAWRWRFTTGGLPSRRP